MIRSLFALLIVTSTVNAQTQMKVYLEDGSMIRCTAVTTSIQVDTAYGPLVVPLSEVKRIQFGLHPTPVEAKSIADARRGLASGVYKDREASRKILTSMGRLAIPTLRHAEKSVDREVSVVSTSLLQMIVEQDPREVRELDSIVATFPIEGRIKAETLSVRSALGESSIPLNKIESLTVIQAEMSLKIQAPKVDNEWVATKFTVSRGDVVTIRAAGDIDLYPQDPGKWKAQPRGYNTAGKGGVFLAGALIGKIGGGQSFMIGEQSSISVQEAGELHLQIVASPWNTASDGAYFVRVKIGQ